MAMNFISLLSMIITGFIGIAAQVIMIRELMISFQGSELSLGIVIAIWLFIESVGSFIAGRLKFSVRSSRYIFFFIQLFTALGLPLSIYIARLSREIVGLPIGQGLGIDAMFYVSFLALLPVSLLHGASFVFGSVVLENNKIGFGNAYVYETLGTMLGGIVITFFLIPYVHSHHISMLLISLAIISVIVLLYESKFLIRRKVPYTLCFLVVLAISSTAFLFSDWFDNLHAISINRQWVGKNVVSYSNSIYGNITVIERGYEYTFFVDGRPIITTPSPDIVRLEEFVHFAMLSHPNPKNVLVLTGGAGGKLNEILKYPDVVTIDYAELDPILIDKIRHFYTPLTYNELNDSRVQVHLQDGRTILNYTEQQFDICFVGIDSPSDLQSNRFFTAEFFSLIESKLSPEGILALSLPSLPRVELNIPGIQLMNSSLYLTLNSVFENVRVFPGESSNIFLASQSEYLTDIDYVSMIRKIGEKDLSLNLLTKPYLQYRTLPWWSENFYESILSSQNSALNLDFTPQIVFYYMMYKSSMFSPRIADILDFAKNNILMLIASLLLIVIVLGLSFRKIGYIATSIFATGFLGMLLDLVLIFSFQIIFGYVFYWIGILVSSFMVGAAVGGYFMLKILSFNFDRFKILIKSEISLVVLAITVPIILLILNRYTFDFIPALMTQAIFVILSVICGFLVGIQYPLACSMVNGKATGQGSKIGLIYGFDLLGGCIGGILGGLLLLPIIGILNSCFVLALMKASTLIVIFILRKFAYA